MKIALLQQDIVWNAPSDNLAKADEMMESAAGAELYVFPEMFPTGFCTHPESISEGDERQPLEWMKKKARETGAAVAGSIAVNEGGRYYNRFFFVKPDQSVTCYDKKHLFTYGGEHEHFTPGDERVVVEWKGVRILLEICYDLRFPVWSRNRGDYDIIIYVASWPTPRIEAWKTLLAARAIENQCFVVGVNRVGTDPYNGYCGGSRMIDPYGHVIALADDGVEMSVSAEIDMDMLETFRAKFPVLNDADRI